MLRYLKGDRMFLSSTALLAVVGLLIALLWAWVWSGAFASARRVAMRLDLRGGSSASEMNRVVWPLMPLLSLLWFVTAELVRHEAMGAETTGSCALVLGLLAVMVAVAIQSLYRGGMPEWAYPGWMARRYYMANPGARERELGAGAVI